MQYSKIYESRNLLGLTTFNWFIHFLNNRDRKEREKNVGKEITFVDFRILNTLDTIMCFNSSIKQLLLLYRVYLEDYSYQLLLS